MSLSIFSGEFLTKLKTVFGKTEWQQKRLTSDSAGIAIASDLNFENLTIGKTYKLTINIYGTSNTDVSAYNNNTDSGYIIARARFDGDTSYQSGVGVFTATSSSIRVKNNANTTLFGGIFDDGSLTNAILEELPNHEETTKFN